MARIATTKTELAFTCVHCEHKAEATVIGVEGTSERAASVVLAHARCPKCSRRALPFKPMRTAVVAVLLLAVFLAIGYGTGAVWLFAPLGVALAVFHMWTRSLKWRAVDGRVHFKR